MKLLSYPTTELLRFPVQRMLATVIAVFLELKPVRIVAAILLRGVVAILALTALQRDDRPDIFLLGSHLTLPYFPIL